MTRSLHVLSILIAFGGLALIALDAVGGGAPDLARIAGRAVMAAEQRSRIEDVIAAYPPLPLVLSLPFAFLAAGKVNAPGLAAALLAGILATALYFRLRAQPVGVLIAFALAVMVVLNPFTLKALEAGPSVVLLMLAMLMLGAGLFGLAGEASPPDMMLVSTALALMAFAHPAGCILVMASVPALAFAAPPSLLVATPLGLLLMLLFPVAFSLFSFAYTRWALGIEPFAFLDTVIAAPRAQESGEAIGLAAYTLLVFPALLLVAPLLPAFLIWARRRPPELRPALALILMVMLTGMLQVLLRGRVDASLLLALSLVAAAVCAAQMARERLAMVTVLMAAGWAGAMFLAAKMADRASAALAAAPALARPQPLPAALARALCPLKGVLVDTQSHPELVQLCGTARGFHVAGEPDFDLQLQSRRLTSPFVLVGREPGSAQLDLVAHSFPDLWRHGAAGYRLIFDQRGWRLYARQSQPLAY
jgi:hypothetical protein